MSATITVHFAGLSGAADVPVDENATIAEVRNAAAILGLDTSGLVIRANGQTVSDEASYTVRDGEVLVTAPPAAKHG